MNGDEEREVAGHRRPPCLIRHAWEELARQTHVDKKHVADASRSRVLRQVLLAEVYQVLCHVFLPARQLPWQMAE